MNLMDVNREFRTEEDCLEELEKVRWPDGVRCITCGCKEVSRINRKPTAKNKRTRSFQCSEKTCKQQFTATHGTMFYRSHIPLPVWFNAIAFIMDAKKGVSALQLQRHLGLGSYESAWYMCHRIRKSMVDPYPAPLRGVIEVDETYLGGSAVRKFRKNPKPRPPKDMVLAMRERGTKDRAGRVRFFHIPDGKLDTIQPVVEANLQPYPERVITDQSAVYEKMFQSNPKAHRTVNHSIEWIVPGTRIHTNTVESSFSLLKRGLIGSFHHVSVKHLHRYLSEFEFRFNERRNEERFGKTLKAMLEAPTMPYKELIASIPASEF
jgi:hypothetical protein